MDEKRDEIYVSIYEEDGCNHGKEKFRTDTKADEVIDAIVDLYNFSNGQDKTSKEYILLKRNGE